MTIPEIDSRIAEIDVRLAEIPPEIAPIQVEIDSRQSELDTINADLSTIQLDISNTNTLVADKQIAIDLKVEERDSLPEEDPLRVPIQDEIDVLVGEKAVLEEELIPLEAQEQAKMDESALKIMELDVELAAKKVLTDEETYLTNERIKLLDDKRKILWQARLDALPDLRRVMMEAGLDQPSIVDLVRDILNSADETKLLQLESAAPAVQADLDDEVARLQKLEDAKIAIKAVDPLTITVGDSILLLKDLVIIMQEQLIR